MRYRIKKLNPLDIAVILLFFEGATFTIMGLVTSYTTLSSNIATGIIVGFLGTIIALAFWNNLGFKIRGVFYEKQFTLTKINIIQASIFNSIFLVVLFTMYDLLSSLREIPTAGIAIIGFAGVIVTLTILLAAYNRFNFKLKLHIDANNTELIRISVISVATIAAIYEALILPLMAYFLSLPVPYLLSFAIAGLASGFIGGLVGTFIFNQIAPKLRLWIELQ